MEYRKLLILVLALWTVFACEDTLAQTAQTDTTQADTTRSNMPEGLDIATLQVSQAHVALPRIGVYLDLRNRADHPVTRLDANQITATVGSHPALVTGVQPFESTGEGVAYIFLVDVSRSLRDAQFAEIKQAMHAWVAAMTSADRAAILTFGETVETVSDFTSNTDTLAHFIESLSPTANRTLLYEGLAQALEIGQRADADLPARRVIIMLSDGIDEQAGGRTKAEVLEQMRTDPTPIYAIGLYNPPRTAQKEEGLRTLGELARTSGGGLQRADATPIATIYEAVRQRVREVLRVELACEACPGDGLVYRIQVTVQAGTRTLTDGLDARFLPGSPPPSPPPLPPPPIPLWAYILGGVVLVSVLGFILYRRANRPEEPPLVAGSKEETEVQETDPETVPGGQAASPTQTPVAPPPKPPAFKVRLVPMAGTPESAARTLSVAGKVRLGRSKTQVEVAFPEDQEMSSIHCCLTREGNRLMIQDLDSTNGTTLNGVPIRGHYRVQDGDVILMGNTELRILILGETA